ncbi:M23 family metallopeptidase [Candidatus Poriferisocius sp.]|uniref:M23 family metallopeptidase n=1 Tax=Candidatus Poriferisocius sp. TaxID=3101276 RepID=UPI003B51D84A
MMGVFRRSWKQVGAVRRYIFSPRGLAVLALIAVGFVLGVLIAQVWTSDGSNGDSATRSTVDAAEPTATAPQSDADSGAASDSTGSANEQAPTDSTSTGPVEDQASTTPGTGAEPGAAAPEASAEPVVVVLEQEPLSYEAALAIAAGLAPHTIYPSDCKSPLPRPDLLPNAPRAYRFGIHQGVDFLCFSLGRHAVAALDGRVVLAVGDYQDPDPDDRDELLEVASALEATPPFTLLSLYGNYVVIDHGVVPFVGHVVTLYAHLHEVDPDIRVGETIRAGERVGEIGNRGTHAAANGDFYEDPHLHWELHIDNQFLGAGLNTEQTREVYTTLFSEALG